MSDPRPFLPPGSVTPEEFFHADLRVGRVLEARAFPEARKPAYRLAIDFGPGGIRRSSAQLPGTYPDPAVLVGRLVIAVVNFAPAPHRRLRQRGARPGRRAGRRLDPAVVRRRGRVPGRPDRLSTILAVGLQAG